MNNRTKHQNYESQKVWWCHGISTNCYSLFTDFLSCAWKTNDETESIAKNAPTHNHLNFNKKSLDNLNTKHQWLIVWDDRFRHGYKKPAEPENMTTEPRHSIIWKKHLKIKTFGTLNVFCLLTSLGIETLTLKYIYSDFIWLVIFGIWFLISTLSAWIVSYHFLGFIWTINPLQCL